MSKAAELANLIGNINAGGGGVNRNFIINGAMNVAQRSASATSVSSEGYHFCDRWRFTRDNSSSVFTLSQDSSVPSGKGFAKSLKVQTTTADTSLASNAQTRIEHRFEGQVLHPLKKGTSEAVPLTLSFYVKSNETGTYIVNLQDTDNNRLNAQTYTISSADTWEYKTITFVGDTTGAFTHDNNLSFVLHFYLSAGSDYTSGSLSTSWATVTSANRAVGITNDIADSTNNNWSITGVQLEVGQNPTSFEHEPFVDTLAKCQRYFLAEAEFKANLFSDEASRRMGGAINFPVTMRAAPTMGTVTDDSGSQVSGTPVISGSTVNCVRAIFVSGSGSNPNIECFAKASADSEL